MEIHDPAVELLAQNNVRNSHQGGPGRASAFLGAQRVLVHDSVNGKNENGPCDVSTMDVLVSKLGQYIIIPVPCYHHYPSEEHTH